MMKKTYFIFIFFLLLCNIALKAQQFSQADSVIYYLKQVKGIQSSDSVLLAKIVAAVFKIAPDSLTTDKIDSELKKLIPVIHKQNYLAVKTAVCIVLSFSKDNYRAVNYSRNLIAELKNYSNEFEKNLLLYTLDRSRFQYRNTNRINEGVEYYQRLANYFEQANDSDATSLCYWVLAGCYRTLGLKDKAIYCQMKSTNFLNRNIIVKGNNFLFAKYNSIGMIGFINRKAVLGWMLIDYE